MKQHRDKDMWRHRPDALPLPDAPSNGVKRKKGALQKQSKKHLLDTAKQAFKELKMSVKHLVYRGIPTKHVQGSWSADCDFAEWACDSVITKCKKMDEVLRELEGRSDG